jgi:Flp pilus assembly pilin Flp
MGILRRLASGLGRFTRDDDGATMVDYVLVVALIMTGAIITLTTVGPKIRNIFDTSLIALDNAGVATNGSGFDGNRKPIVAAIAPVTVFTGESSSTTAVRDALSDPDGDSVTVTFASGATLSGTLVVASSGALSMAPPYDGAFLPATSTMNLRAYDGRGGELYFPINVQILPGRLMIQDQTFNLGSCSGTGSGSIRVYDYRHTDPSIINLSFSGAPAWWASSFSITGRSYDSANRQAVISFTASKGSPGPVSPTTFFVTATDGEGHTNSGNVTISCSP